MKKKDLPYEHAHATLPFMRDWLPGCSATRPPSCDLLVIGCPDRCLDLALAMQKACGSLAQQIRGKRAFPRSLARAGATRAEARRKICPTHVHPPIQSLSPLSLATKNRPTKLAYLACIGPGQPWPGSLMRARFTREVNQSDPCCSPRPVLHAENQAPFSQADAMQLAVVWLSEYL